MKHSPISRREWGLLVAIVLLAAWLRLTHLSDTEFQWDQAEISKWAIRMARHGEIAWVGPLSSTRLDSFMGAIWLLAVPYALSPDPLFATGFIATINVIAVIGCYGLARHWFGRSAALTAALLHAVAPWAIVYSRKIWQVDLIPPFALLHAVTTWLAFVRGRRWALLIHGLLAAGLFQIHFSAFPFILLSGLWALIFYKRIDWRVVMVTGSLAALTFIPYFVIDARQSWWNVRHLDNLVHQPATLDADAARAAWIISAGLNLHWLTGPDRYPDFVAATPNLRWLFGVEGGLVITGGLVAAGWTARRVRRLGHLDDEAAAVLIVITWLLMPILFLTRHNTPVAPHYFTSTFPAQFLLIGWLAAWLGHQPGRLAQLVQGLFGALTVALAVSQSYESMALLRFIAAHNTPQGFGIPLAYELQAVQTAAQLGQEIKSTEVILLSEGDDPRMFEMPAVADVLLYERPHRAVDIRTALVFPANPAVYWVTLERTPGEEILQTLTPERVDARILLRNSPRSFRFYQWTGGEPGIAGVQPLPGGPYTWSNGVQLVGYQWAGEARPGKTVRWTWVWRVTHAGTQDDAFHWFNHLLDAQGQLRGQYDGPSFLPLYWQPGDTVLNWFDLYISQDAPPGEYTIRVGMYTYPGVENVPLENTDRAWIEFALLRVEP